MLHRPFLKAMHTSSNGRGWYYFFLELPLASTVCSSILGGTMEKEIINKLVFPFLFAIGLMQAVFFGYHMLYVVSALTTLEYKILLDMKFKQVTEHPSSSSFKPPNPFSRGWAQNLQNAFGPIYLMFLPIQVDQKQINPTLNASTLKGK
jgi:hypothetical protein